MTLLLILFIVISYFDVKQLINIKYWHELRVLSLFLFITALLLILYVLNLPLPNPIKIMEYAVKALHLNYK